MKRFWGDAARASVLPFLVLVLWECLARAHRLPEALSSPEAIAKVLAVTLADGSLLGLTVQTIAAAAAGWLLGALLGIVGGLAIGTVPLLRTILGPALGLMRSVPPVALIPVALLALGLGPELEILMVAFAVFWPVVVFTATGLGSLDPRLLEVGRALRLCAAEQIVQLVLPAAAPMIAVGLRLGAGIALVVAVTTEIVANPSGLGYGISFASATLRPDIMFADLFCLAVLGFAINASLVAIERSAFAWTRG